MAFSYSFLQNLVQTITPDIVGSYLNRIVHFSRASFSFSLSNSKSKKMIVSLDNSEPLLTLTDQEITTDGQSTMFYLLLRKEVSGALVTSLTLQKNDRIIVLKLTAPDLALIERNLTLYIELIPMQPNMILTDENDRIVTLWRPSKTLDVVRPLAIGLQYEPPLNQNLGTIWSADEQHLLDFDTNLIAQSGLYMDQRDHFSALPNPQKGYEPVTPEIIFNRVTNRLEQSRRNELFRDVFRLIERKNKLLTQKCKRLRSELATANQHIDDQIKADLLLTYASEIKSGSNIFFQDKIEIKLDPSLSPIENANRYYKRYRKAKTAQIEIAKQIELAEDELNYFQGLRLNATQVDEQGLKEIKSELALNGYLPKMGNSKKLKETIRPYFCFVDGIKIGFGKNNLQNDELTFNRSHPFDTFVHVKNYSGAHVVIFAREPSDKILTIAAAIALYLSKMNDGEVMIAPIKNVKHLDRPGRVKIRNYRSVYLREISADIAPLIQNAKRN